MSLNKGNLLELDVEKLFEERSVDYIIEIERLIDDEIEKKRGELRLMVGDRYKDVLAASDAIKSMKSTSEDIVNNIKKISHSCEELIAKPSNSIYKNILAITKSKNDERTLLIQLRLTIFLNEQIWNMLDEENNLDAVQYYLLAQHIHTGLSLLKQDDLRRIPILYQIKNTLKFLRSKIFQKITEKLESVETTPEETSMNLNALMLLENQTSIDLLNVFIKHRKIALQTVISMEYSSVRVQICSMVRCLLTTVTLLYECFLDNKNGERGLIWKHVIKLSEEKASATLPKLNLPVTPLTLYIPEILKTFRPRYKIIPNETYINNVESVMKNWLESTHHSLSNNLKKLLQLITSVRGLHLAKEESLKIEMPENWEQICLESYFPKNFDIWNYFFQDLFTERSKTLISQKISTINLDIRKYVNEMLEDVSSTGNPESKLRNTIWIEDSKDIIKNEKHIYKGLTMKTKGFSEVVVDLCIKLDKKYVELLEDVSQYLYDKEYTSEMNLSLVWKDFKFKRKHSDTVYIENHLRMEATNFALKLPEFIENICGVEIDSTVAKSIISARFLQSTLQICPNFKKCCSFNDPTEDWTKICDSFNRSTNNLWKNWLEDIKKETEKRCTDFSNLSPKRSIEIMIRWDEIEIQEQIEEKVFSSQIKVPLKPSLGLHYILLHLNNNLSEILPFTLPKSVHVQFIEENIAIIFNHYKTLLNGNITQKQAVQFLFDVRFLTTFCIPRENVQLVSCSQEICDNLRSKIDPFDLDVFYSYIQNNVKRAVVQSQIFLGCLLPSSTQLANLGLSVEKNKDLEKKPSILAVSRPSTSSWFPLLPISFPIHKRTNVTTTKKIIKDSSQKNKSNKKSQDSTKIMKQSTSSFFGGLNTDWFS